MTDKPELEACPFCGTDDHLHIGPTGSMTNDMPSRPYRVACTHIDHDAVIGPVAYGKQAAIAAWNTRATPAQPDASALVGALATVRTFLVGSNPLHASNGIRNLDLRSQVDAALSAWEAQHG